MTPEELNKIRAKYGIVAPQGSSKDALRAKVRAGLQMSESKKIAPVKPDIQPQKTSISDKMGGVLKTASDFMFGSTIKTVGTTIAAPILESQGKTEQAKKLVNENLTPLNIAFTAIELYPGGGFVSQALKKLPGGEAIAKAITTGIPEGLKSKAIKQFSEALRATTKELKSKTKKVVPELLKRNTLVTSLKKFGDKASELKSVAGEAVGRAEDLLPVFKQTVVKPLVDSVSTLRNEFIVNGKILDEGAVRAIDNVVGAITQYGKSIPDAQLIKIKRVLDKSVAIANKNFTKDEGLTLATQAKEGIANTIRNTLNTSHPNLGVANKEFNLWSDIEKIVEATLARRSTQSNGITRFIAPLIGGGAGFASGGTIKAVVGYFATDAAIRLFQSPAYKTISAVNKNKLAEYLASGRIKEALVLTSKLISGIRNETK